MPWSPRRLGHQYSAAAAQPLRLGCKQAQIAATSRAIGRRGLLTLGMLSRECMLLSDGCEQDWARGSCSAGCRHCSRRIRGVLGLHQMQNQSLGTCCPACWMAPEGTPSHPWRAPTRAARAAHQEAEDAAGCSRPVLICTTAIAKVGHSRRCITLILLTAFLKHRTRFPALLSAPNNINRRIETHCQDVLESVSHTIAAAYLHALHINLCCKLGPSGVQ